MSCSIDMITKHKSQLRETCIAQFLLLNHPQTMIHIHFFSLYFLFLLDVPAPTPSSLSMNYNQRPTVLRIYMRHINKLFLLFKYALNIQAFQTIVGNPAGGCQNNYIPEGFQHVQAAFPLASNCTLPSSMLDLASI